MAKRKKRYDPILGFGKLAIGASVMSGAIGAVGSGTVAQKGQLGMTRMAGYFPAVGGIIGVGITLNTLGELQKAVPRRPRRRRPPIGQID